MLPRMMKTIVLVPFLTSGMPWARQPGSVIYEIPKTSLYFGLRVLHAEVSSGGVLDERMPKSAIC